MKVVRNWAYREIKQEPGRGTRVAQNLEILEKLSSQGGSIFLFGYMERKKKLAKVDKIFKNIFSFTCSFTWIHPGRLTFRKFPNFEPPMWYQSMMVQHPSRLISRNSPVMPSWTHVWVMLKIMKQAKKYYTRDIYSCRLILHVPIVWCVMHCIGHFFMFHDHFVTLLLHYF